MPIRRRKGKSAYAPDPRKVKNGISDSNSNSSSSEKCECPPEEEVIKSPLDPNDYKLLTLKNGLRALVVSTCENGRPSPKRTVNVKSGVIVEVEEFNRLHLSLDPEEEADSTSKPVEESQNSKGDCGHEEPDSKRSKLDSTTAGTQTDLVKIPKTKKGCGYGYFSVAVGAGAYNDPDDYPGLAHLCEHGCVKFGSKKYPENSGFQKLIGSCGGHYNASTHSEFTAYFFRIDLANGGESRFRLGVDMVAHFMNDPLLPIEEIQQEVNAVDSEFSVNREACDMSRLYAILNSTVDPGHPEGHFNCGNYESLNHGKLNERLCEWRKRHYAPNYMTLVIRAALPLDDLEQLVRNSFEQFSSSDAEKPRDELRRKFNSPFDREHKFNRLYKFAPINENLKFMMIGWELPPKFVNDLETRPLLYLVRHFEGGCSLIDYLQTKHWVYNIYSRYTSPGATTFRSYFSITVYLTEEGLNCCDQVILAIYSYLKMIKTNEVSRDLFQEIQREHADRFHYQPILGRVDEAVGLSTSMLGLKDHKHVLTSEKLVTTFDSALIKECLDLITPDNMNIILCSKSFAPECNTVTKWFNTKFTQSEFREEFLDECDNVSVYEEFRPPEPFNPLRVKRIDCKIHIKESSPSTPVKKVVLADGRAFVCFYNDNSCKLGNDPHGSHMITIASPMIRPSPLATGFATLWEYMLRSKLRPMIQLAMNARITLCFSKFHNFFEVVLFGPSHHLTNIAKEILRTFMDFVHNLEERSFEHYKAYAMGIYQGAMINSDFYMQKCQSFVFRENSTMFEQIVHALKEATYQDFQKFMEIYTDRMHIGAALVGCIPESNVKSLTDYIRLMAYRELPIILPKIRRRTLQLPLGERCLRIKTHNPCECSSRVFNHYQFGKLKYQKELLLEKLAYLMNKPAFYQLRTTEHLSYVVGTSYSWLNNSLVIAVYPQPHRHTTAYTDGRISEFLVRFRQWFGCYNDVFANKENPDLSLIPVTSEEHKIILELFDKHLLPTGAKFRKLSFQIVGHVNPIKKIETMTASALVEEKIEKFSPVSYSFNPSSSKLNIPYDIPECVKEENGYFITDLEAFKCNLEPLQRD